MFQSKSFSFAIAVAVLVATAFAGTSQATQIPIPVTGFTQNMILGASETWPGTLTATMDAGTPVSNNANTWYAIGQNQNVGATLTGLPSGTVTSAFDPTTTLTLQPAGVNNTVLIDGGHTSDTLTLTHPGNYSTLSLFGSTGGGTNVVDYTLHFGGGSTQSGSVTFSDWFNGSNAAVIANGRISSTGYDSVNGGNPQIYQVNVPFTFTNGLQLLSISLTQDTNPNNHNSGHTAIFALSGAQGAPEPSTFVLAGLGTVGLLLAARRRRRA
jgi:hypothetical protein